ncbi:MAG: FapA family protein [Deltaproteobacteria bacterium]|nr:FapA family protein [Deltaproteobacteria bacterium]
MSDQLELVSEIIIGDCYVRFYTDAEKMKLFCSFQKKIPFMVAKAAVENHVEKHFGGVKLDFEVLRDSLTNAGDRPRRIGLGKPCVPPQDEKLILLAKPFSLSYSGFKFIDNIEPGREVARIIPPKQGEIGFDIFGNPIKPPDPKRVSVQIGNNLQAQSSEKHLSLLSKVYGYLFYDQKQIDVREELVIEGGVTQATGNIRFNNRIRILGNVGVGFIVKTDQEVLVEGDIFREAEVYSRNSSIIVKGSVLHAKLAAKNKVEVEKTLEANISGAEVVIRDEALNSRIHASDSIVVKNVIGGHLVGVKTISVISAGNKSGIKTILEIVADASHSKKIAELSNKIASLNQAEKLLRLQLGPYEFKSVKDMPDEVQKRIQELRNKLEKVQNDRGILKKELSDLLKASSQISGEIVVNKIGHAGVRFVFRDETLELFEDKKGPFVVRIQNDKLIL